MMDLAENSTLGHDSVSTQVVKHLLGKINDLQLRPGDEVDSEVQVSRELGVSRGSVREAYRILAALGVLDVANGRRPRIHAVNSSALAQIFGHALQIAQATPLHVQEFRRGVEVHGAQLAARFATDRQRATLRSLIADMRASMDDEARRRSADLAIHVTLAEASTNPLNTLILTALQSAISQSLRGDYQVQRSDAEIVRIIDVHEAVVEAVCAGDPVAAGSAMACHFDLSINSLFRTANAARLAGEAAST
jgi:GntR family transcriptional regulator, transcriptional repressor for pyruvate dehydrogenase complex